MSLKEKVKSVLNKMAKLEVSKPEPTDWVHPIVVVQKPNGQIGIRMDHGELNKYIKRENYPISTQQNLLSQVEGEFSQFLMRHQPFFL